MVFFQPLPEKTLRSFYFILWLGPKWFIGVLNFFGPLRGRPPIPPIFKCMAVISSEVHRKVKAKLQLYIDIPLRQAF